MPLYDAHCHLQDPRLASQLDTLSVRYESAEIAGVVVNGTRESDWSQVVELTDRFPFVKPSFGLHPWFVNEASADWKNRLEDLWGKYPESGVGEIGLDRWIEGYDLERQLEAFDWQLQQGKMLDRPVSIHCLRAWGILLERLQKVGAPERGFLLHSYGGSQELVRPLAGLGAYFSISAYFALDRKKSQHAALRAIPLDRLLIETDAPDMLGPDRFRKFELAQEDGEAINHPANLPGVYEFVAQLRAIPSGELSEAVAENWNRFFAR